MFHNPKIGLYVALKLDFYETFSETCMFQNNSFKFICS